MKSLILGLVLVFILTVTICPTAYGETWREGCNTCTGDRHGVSNCTLLHCGGGLSIDLTPPEKAAYSFIEVHSDGETIFTIDYSGRISGESDRLIGQLNKRELKLFKDVVNTPYTWSLTGADK